MMMSIRKSIIIIAAALSLTACAITVKEQDAPSTLKVTFNSEVIESRTSFEEPEGTIYPVRWTDNDKTVLLSLNKADATDAQVVVEEGRKRAWFTSDVTVGSTTAPFVFYSVSPASAATAMNKTHGGWSVTIPSTQTPSVLSPDESAQILVGASNPLTSIPEKVSLYFKHLSAYGKFSLKNLPSTVTSISSVELTAGAPIAGNWFYNVEEQSMESNGASSTITINTTSFEDIWFACAPQDLSGKTLKVTVSTNLGKFARTITLPEGSAFKPGKISTFSVDMSKSEPVVFNKIYRLVTSLSSLEKGDNVIITQAPSDYAADGPLAVSTSAAARYINPEGVTVSGDTPSEMVIANPSEKVQVFTLVSGENGLWAFKSADGFLNSNGEKNVNYVALPSEKSYWGLTINESDGEAVLTSSYGYYLRYNSQSPRFTTYRETSSVKINVAIYKEYIESVVVTDEDPILSESVYGAYLTSGNRLYSAGTDQISNEFGETDEDFIIIQPSSETVMTFGGFPQDVAKGSSFSLSFTVVTGKKTVIKTVYPVSVVREDGPKLWLSDGAGHGFIVKK